MREAKFQASEVVLNCVEGPATDPPILLLHGLFDRWQILLPIIDVLSVCWHVHCFDMRGHGESGRVPKSYLPQDYYRDTAEFLCDRFEEPVVILGHSAGGLIALWCVADYPERVRAVINGDLFSSAERLAALLQRRESIAHHEELQSLAARSADRILSSELASYVPNAGRAAWAEAISLLDPDTMSHPASGDGGGYMAAVGMDAILGRVQCSVRLLSGENDSGAVMTDDDVEYACSHLDYASHVSLDNVGHDLGLFSSNTGPLLQAVNQFLESL
jgi:pimeloyl-ACP methyl ester carboxylesterase